MITYDIDPILRRLQLTQLDILKEVAKVCEKNGIRYCLCGGTLLGAIRHKGFIPWDDDIDILMPRPDFMKFIEVFEKQNHDNYRLTSIYNNNKHIYTYAKVFDNRTRFIEPNVNQNKIGINIDVFPMDGLPKEITQSDYYFKIQKKLFVLLSLSISKYKKSKTILRTIVKFEIMLLCRILGRKRIIMLINKRAMKYNFDTSIFSAVSIVPYYGNKERVRQELFTKYIKVEFEGELFNAPIGYHEYLTNLYGDYMQLPPMEKRVTHHKNEFYW